MSVDCNSSVASLAKGALSFPKEERLHHRSLVERLFRSGKSFYEFPFKVIWQALSEEELKKNFRNNPPDGIGSMQLLITVPKKKRKLAVDRVLMRRRIREAYRLNRLPLKKATSENPNVRVLNLALIYIHNANLPYALVEEKMESVLARLRSKFTTQD